MNNDNRISLNIPADVQAQALEHFRQGAALIDPYLISLTPEEAKGLPKVGDKGYAFVNKGNEYLQSPTTSIPPYVDKDEVAVDLAGYDTLRQFAQVIRPILDRVEDTMTLSGSEAYVGVLSFYGYIKGAAKSGVSGAQTIYDDLSARFPGRKSK